jgi:hypothetical protein
MARWTLDSQSQELSPRYGGFPTKWTDDMKREFWVEKGLGPWGPVNDDLVEWYVAQGCVRGYLDDMANYYWDQLALGFGGGVTKHIMLEDGTSAVLTEGADILTKEV